MLTKKKKSKNRASPDAAIVDLISKKPLISRILRR
jgi:hypothetical protein